MQFPKFAGKYSKLTKSGLSVRSPVVSETLPRQTPKIPSLVTPGGSTAVKPTKHYSGDKMVGISIIHKSCLQPVFSVESAKDAASMRR